MRELLLSRLHDYLVQNNPDLLLTLQEEQGISAYLHQKVDSIQELLDRLLAEDRPPSDIVETCMQELTDDLRPSRYHYFLALLADEFPDWYRQLKESGTLTYEIAGLIASTQEDFEAFGFSEENQEDRFLRYTAMGAIQEHFASERTKKVNRDGVQFNAKAKR